MKYSFVDDYSPITIAECILPKSIKAQLQAIIDKGELVNNLLFSGGPGIGKTTAAKALCEQLGCEYLFHPGSKENGIDALRTTIDEYASTGSMDGKRRVIIIDESDRLAPNFQDALRGVIEDHSENCSYIFTCNNKNKITEALRSRFVEIDFKIPSSESPSLALEFFNKTKFILNERNIEYNQQVLIQVIQMYFPDFRKTLNEIQGYTNHGPLDVGFLSRNGSVVLTEAITFMKNKDFGKLRTWVDKNIDDTSRLYRKLYDDLSGFLNPESVPEAILIIADHMYKDGFVADKEVNFMACLTSLMIRCQFN